MWRSAAITAVLAALLAGCSLGGSGTDQSLPSPTKQESATCPSALVHYGAPPAGALSVGVPPDLPWIATGSNEITGSMFYYRSPVFSHRMRRAVIGAGGRAGDGGATKILWWVEGRGATSLTVTGQRLDAAGSFRQVIPGPSQGRSTFFPSIITVPTSGCWRLELHAGSAAGSVTMRAVIPTGQGGAPKAVSVVAENGKTTFRPGKLHTGDSVVCKASHIGARVPEPGGGVAGSGFIVVEHQTDGTVVVECHPPPSGSTGGFG